MIMVFHIYTGRVISTSLVRVKNKSRLLMSFNVMYAKWESQCKNVALLPSIVESLSDFVVPCNMTINALDVT